MYVDFKELSEEAKVWVYPSSRKFYPQEIETITQKIKQFVSNWKSDDLNFKASYKIVYNRFIIFSSDENSLLSNTDIDAQVAFIIALQEELKVVLLDKMNVCFKQGDYVQYKELKEFKKLIKNKSVSEKTLVFDNLVTTKSDLENYWELPITESWYNRFL